MSKEPAEEAPVAAASDDSAKPHAKSIPQTEYDDFGLPIRTPKPRSQVSADNSGSEDDVFKDAVASTSASKEDVALPQKPAQEEHKETTTEQDGAKDALVENSEDNPATPTVNGHREAESQPPEASDKQQDIDKAAPPIDDTSDARQRANTASTVNTRNSLLAGPQAHVSEYSHQQLAPQTSRDDATQEEEGEWQTMPAYARWDMYNDDNKLIARENAEELEDMSGYGNVGGAAKGYTRVTMDDDVESQTSMDENTAYLFKEKNNTLVEDEEDEAARDPLTQMQATKSLLTEGQRIAYVGLARLAMVEMEKRPTLLNNNKKTKKMLELTQETTKMWAQKMMVRLYTHMEVDNSEQIMIEQLQAHGVIPGDLTPALMLNARVKNPAAEEEAVSPTDTDSTWPSISSPRPEAEAGTSRPTSGLGMRDSPVPAASPALPAYQDHEGDDLPAVRTPSQLPSTKNLDIDLRWTILCDLFLVLVADSVYDARSRHLLEAVAKYLSVDWLEICRFEKRVTDALEMQEEANKENWNEDEHMEDRRKKARNKRLALMGLATVGGSLVIGLSAGLLAPVIGAGLAAGFTTIGVAGTSGFLAGAGGAAIITTTGVLSGGTIAVRAANRRTGAVKTFEYRPLHNNKKVNLIVTISGWMSGNLDDVRLPYSTVDPIMGDIYSVHWEPEMLRSMGDTINILATEALTQGLQQVLGSTILIALMAAIQLPVALTKLSYLIDNPWTVSQARADMAGLILADSLIARNLGTRPVTLVGFSLGARVIYSCLKELVRREAFGLVQNVYMFGTPVVANMDEYTKARAIVPGRFVHGYARNDWILGYLFRATSGGIMKVAGLAPVDLPGIENFDVTELVPGHMAYRAAMPKLLRTVGWEVESDEFTEIEDPDPENHERRQRELINEIEEARKELEEKQKKKGRFSFWGKKKAAKKDWEVYDENSVKPLDKDADPATLAENPIMFDVDAIRKEVAQLAAHGEAELAAEGIEVREIKSTLPPMKIDMAATSPNPYATLRPTKSHNDSLSPAASNFGGSTSNLSIYSNGAPSPNQDKDRPNKSFEEYDEHDNGGMTMTFDSSFREPVPRSPSRSPIASHEATPERPTLKSASTEPNLNLAPSYNAWADDDDDEFGKEKEVKMTFE